MVSSTFFCRALRWGCIKIISILFFSTLTIPCKGSPRAQASLLHSRQAGLSPSTLIFVSGGSALLCSVSILPISGRDVSICTAIYVYMYICTNALLSVSVFILSSTLVLSLSKGRNKYLSEIICCQQAYCLQGIRVPFWGASILCYWLISCILFGVEGLKA